MSTKDSCPIPPVIIKTSTEYKAVAYTVEYAAKKLHEVFSSTPLPGYVEIVRIPSVSTTNIKPVAMAVLNSSPKRTKPDYYRISTPASTSSDIYSNTEAEEYFMSKILDIYKNSQKRKKSTE